jgi:hypothetical protein
LERYVVIRNHRIRALSAVILAVSATATVLPFMALAAGPEVSGVTEHTDGSRLSGLGVLLPPNEARPFGGAWLQPYWFGRIAEWSTRDRDTRTSRLWDLQVGKRFRLSAQRRPSGRWFAEVGFSGHLLSHTDLDHRQFGTAFQFGEDLGVGVDFGYGGTYSALLRLEHISNGGIVSHNDGMTFIGMELRARLR